MRKKNCSGANLTPNKKRNNFTSTRFNCDYSVDNGWDKL